MEEVFFTLNGKQLHLKRSQVIAAMRRQTPGTIQVYAVDVEGRWFPPKQVLAQALQIRTSEFITTRAQDLLTKLDFRVVHVEAEPDYRASGQVTHQDSSAQTAERSADAALRRIALELAVRRHGSDGNIAAARVLETADAFLSWLEA